MCDVPEVLQIKVRLLGISPMIWMRVLVLSTLTLHELHGIRQVALGWRGIHLFQFDVRSVPYGSPELGYARPGVTLHSFSFRQNDRFFYPYDIGAGWQREIRVEKIVPADPKIASPVCIGGAGACPPEECGGAYGFLARRDG